MNRFIKHSLLLLLLMLGSLPSLVAHAYEIDNIDYQTTTIGNVTGVYVWGITNTNISTIKIPESIEINGKIYPVISIGTRAFENISSLKEVELPETMLKIGSSAFSDCVNLEKINLPNSITNLEHSAFYNCPKLTSLTLPENLVTLESYAFYKCANAFGSVLVIPDKTETIEYCAFSGCSSISTLIIGEGLKQAGSSNESCFALMGGLKDIWMKPTTPPEYIGPKRLGKSVTLHVPMGSVDAYKAIEEWAATTIVGYEPHEINDTEVVDGLTYKYDKASSSYFVAPQSNDETQNYRTIKNLVIPNKIVISGSIYTVGGILEDAFAGSTVSSFTIPENITSIPAGAFRNCLNLVDITIPKQIETIGAEAFAGCSNLKNIVCNSAVPPAIQENTFSISTYENAKLNVLTDYEEAYKNATGWSNFSRLLFEKYQILSNMLWYELNSLSLEATVIAEQHEDGSTSTNYISHPYSTYTIAKSLTYKDHDFAVKAIADGAFAGARMAKLIIPDNIKTIGEEVFTNSTILSIDVPSLEYWYSMFGQENRPFTQSEGTLFVNGEQVTSITISKDSRIPTYAFKGCSGITQFSVENGVDKFTTAYEGVNNVTTLNLGEDLTEISNEAVAGMTSLRTVRSARMQAPALPENAFDSYVYRNATLYIPVIGSESYDNGGWSGFNYKTLEDVTLAAYPDFKFAKPSNTKGLCIKPANTSIKGDIVIPSEITAQGSKYAITEMSGFTDCSDLLSLSIPSSVTSVNGLSGCTNLSKLYFEDWDSFYATTFSITPYSSNGSSLMIYIGGTVVKDLTVPSNVTSVQNWFAGYKGLESVTIPATVTTITSEAFSDCSNLKTVNLKGNIYYNSSITISSDAFRNAPVTDLTIGRTFTYPKCSAIFPDIKNLIIADNVSAIPDAMFKGASNLESVKFNNGIKSLGTEAFSDCKSLASVSLPATLTSLGSYAFSGCSSLTSIAFPQNLTEITSGCFEDCSKLSTITWNGIAFIESEAFSGCTSLKELTIPATITYINDNAFTDCSALSSVSFDKTDIELQAGETIFKNCPLNSVNYSRPISRRYTASPFSQTATAFDLYVAASVGQGLFENVTLKSVVFAQGITEIGSRAFYGCKALEKLVVTADMVKIGSEAFRDCENLNEIEFEDSRNELELGSNVFNSCKIENLYLGRTIKTAYNDRYGFFANNLNLKSLVLGRYVTEISDYEFYNCPNLHSLTIGVGVRKISPKAFTLSEYASETMTIAKVIWLPNTRPQGYENIHAGVNYVSQSSYDLENQIEYANLSSKFWVDGVLYVFNRQASDRTCVAIDCKYSPSLKATEIPNQVEYRDIQFKIEAINDYAFYMNEYIENAKVGNNIQSIGDYAFFGCDKLQSIFVPNSVKILGAWAFAGCSKMESAVVGTGLTEIREGCFSGDALIPEFMVPANVLSIGNKVFDGCKGLKKFEIMNRTKELYLGYSSKNIDNSDNPIPGRPLFADSELEEVYIGGNISYSTLVEDGYSPFYRNDYLRKVTIHDQETEVSDYEFYGCSNLQEVLIGNGVERIGDYAFSGCFELTSFSFGSKVKSIGVDAFSDCTRMTSLTSHNPYTPVCGAQALDDIDKFNCTLFVPANSVTAYQNAEQWKNFFNIRPIQAVAVPVTSLTLNVRTLTLMQGEQEQIDATIAPADATIPTLYWESSDADVAMVSQFGNVVAIGPGNCYVTATTTDGSDLSQTCFVTVNEYSGVLNVEIGEIRLIRHGKVCIIEGAADDDDVCVVGLNGNIEYKGKEKTLDTLSDGMHIIIVRNQVFKVMI